MTLEEAKINFDIKEKMVILASQKLMEANAEVRRLRAEEKKALGALYDACRELDQLKQENENA